MDEPINPINANKTLTAYSSHGEPAPRFLLLGNGPELGLTADGNSFSARPAEQLTTRDPQELRTRNLLLIRAKPALIRPARIECPIMR